MKRLLAMFLTALVLLLNISPAFATALDGRVETWGDWEVVQAPTCTEPGTQKRVSSYGNTESEPIRPLGHTPGEWVTARPATCLQREYQELHCSVCYQVMDNRFVGEKGEHTWGEWEETVSESGTFAKTRQRVCTVCGKTEKEETVWADLPAMSGAPLEDASLTLTVTGETEGVLDAKNGRAKVRITAKNTGNKPLLVTAINPGKNTDSYSGWGAEFINELAPGDEGGFDYTVIVDEADAIVHKSVHREISLGYKYTDDDGESKYDKSNKIILDYSLSGLEDMVTDPPALPSEPETPPAEPKDPSGDTSLTLTASGETEGVLDAKNGRAKVRITAKNTGNKPLLVTAINPGKNTDSYSGWGAEFINELAPGEEGGFDYTVIVDEADAIVHKSVHREISLGYKYTDDDGESKYGKSNKVVLDYTLEGLPEDPVPPETPTEPEEPSEKPETPPEDPDGTPESPDHPPEEPKDMIDLGVDPSGGVHEPYHEGDEVTFEITVFNHGTRDLFNVMLYLPDGSYDEIGTIEAGDKAKREYTHKVTHDEAAVKKEFRCVFDACGWPDLKKPPIWAPTHSWILAAADGSETDENQQEKAGLNLTCVSNVPAGAKAGDIVSGLFTLTNTGDVPLTFVNAYLLPYPGCYTDPNADDDMSGWVPYLNQVIDPKDDISAAITTVVTADDEAAGKVVREVYCRCDDPSGERVASNFANLEGSLTAEDEHGDPNPPEEPNAQKPVTIVKARVGKPMHEAGYQADEMIHYTVTVTNVSEQTVYSLQVTDALAGKDPIATRPSLSKDDGPWVISFDYVVRESDFDGGAQILYNTAEVLYRNENQAEDKLKSNTAEAPLWRGTENAPDENEQPKAQDQRECVRTLNLMNGSGAEYTLSLCAEHEALLRETRGLIESAAYHTQDRLAAMQNAADRWQSEVQALYQLLPEETGGAGFNAFIDMLGAGESLLQNCLERSADEIAQWKLEQLYLRCVDLCYALHHAPDKNRPDSQVTGSFQDVLTSLVPMNSELSLRETEGGWLLGTTLCAEDAKVFGTLRRAAARANGPEAFIGAFNTAAEAFKGRLAQHARQWTLTLNANTRHAALLWQTYASAYLDFERTLYDTLYPKAPEIAAELTCRAALELLLSVQ